MVGKERKIHRDFLKVETAAELIEVSPWTIRKWIKEKRIRTYRFGGAVRIKESDLLDFAAVTPGKTGLVEQINIP